MTKTIDAHPGGKKNHGSSYLELLLKSSVPLVQSIIAFGAALGWQWMIISPPRAAGIKGLTGFSRKSGANAEDKKQCECIHEFEIWGKVRGSSQWILGEHTSKSYILNYCSQTLHSILIGSPKIV